MAILATSTGNVQRELIPAGNHIARAYQMIHLGTIDETYLGEPKKMNKVRITWELPEELRVFDQAKGEQPMVIGKEFTLSLHEKSTLRKALASWRGKDFTEEEAKSFDITKLVGAPCMLNVIHKPSKDGSKIYTEISSISTVPKSMKPPAQINPSFILSYDEWDEAKFNTLPDWIRDKMKTSAEYKAMNGGPAVKAPEQQAAIIIGYDGLPFHHNAFSI